MVVMLLVLVMERMLQVLLVEGMLLLVLMMEGMRMALHWCWHAWGMLQARAAGRRLPTSAAHAWLSCLAPPASYMLLRAYPYCPCCHTACRSMGTLNHPS